MSLLPIIYQSGQLYSHLCSPCILCFRTSYGRNFRRALLYKSSRQNCVWSVTVLGIELSSLMMSWKIPLFPGMKNKLLETIFLISIYSSVGIFWLWEMFGNQYSFSCVSLKIAALEVRTGGLISVLIKQTVILEIMSMAAQHLFKL